MIGKRFFSVVLLLGLLVFSPALYADLLAGWDINGVDLSGGLGIDTTAFPYTKTSTVRDANIDSGLLSLGFDGPSATDDTYGFRFSAATHQSSLSDAIAADSYIQFSVAAASGYRFDITSIEMKGASGSSGVDDIALMSSVDGFQEGSEMASLTGLQGVTGGWDTDASGWGDSIQPVGKQYQDLETIVFRIYGWNSTGASSSGIRDLSGPDLVVNGEVKAIPEPAVATLIGMTGIGILMVRRLKK